MKIMKNEDYEIRCAKELDREVEFEGRTYNLIQEPYAFGPEDEYIYKAVAICFEDELNEYGEMPAYEVTWNLQDDYDPENQEEEFACDWDSPDKVEII